MSTEPTGIRVPSAAFPLNPDPAVLSSEAAPRRRRVRGEEVQRDAAPARPKPRWNRPRPSSPSAAPVPGAGGRAARRNRKVRRVHRVIRHLEIWSVFKVAAVFAACSYFVAIVSGYLLWRTADRVGTISGIEGFMEDAGGYDRFELAGDVVFRSASVLLAVLAAFGVFVVVLGAVLFNLISDLTGGIRMTVIDEDLIVTTTRPRPAAGPPEMDPDPGAG